MTWMTWAAAPRFRRGMAAAAVVLAAGGLVLFRAEAKPAYHDRPDLTGFLPSGSTNIATFSGPGLHGSLALSQTTVLPGAGGRLFADLTLVADAASVACERAPLALVIALDTSGSMTGEKIAQAKSAITRMVRDMRDTDDVALVRYSDSAELIQPLASVGAVRESLLARVNALEAGGGTAIPLGLASALDALTGEHGGRVRRVVLVSDGLDSSRPQSERLASSSFERGITISSMGIGLDFDEAYMSGVARSGHGNFGFVNDGLALAQFLTRELKETASTTVEGATIRVALPPGVRFVRATGADVRPAGGGWPEGQVDLKIGALASGEERRVLLELATSLDAGSSVTLSGSASWMQVGAGQGAATIPSLSLVAVNDPAAVERSRDGTVWARATSVTASERQLRAAEAYAQGDTAKADSLIKENLDDLKAAQAAAPPPAASALSAQVSSYESTRRAFKSFAPATAAGKTHAKAAVEKNYANSSAAGAF